MYMKLFFQGIVDVGFITGVYRESYGGRLRNLFILICLCAPFFVYNWGVIGGPLALCRAWGAVQKEYELGLVTVMCVGPTCFFLNLYDVGWFYVRETQIVRKLFKFLQLVRILFFV